MKKTNKVGIVILNWYGTKLFTDFLPSVIEHSQGENIEIIIADNGSTDNSLNYLKTNFPFSDEFKSKLADNMVYYYYAQGGTQNYQYALAFANMLLGETAKLGASLTAGKEYLIVASKTH